MKILELLFSTAWGTVSLIELFWTGGALLAMLVAFWAVWLRRGVARYLQQNRGLNAYERTWANRDRLFRKAMLGTIMEIAFFLGLWSMLEPQGASLTSSAAIAGFSFWLVELAIISVILFEELVHQLIFRHQKPERPPATFS